MNGYKEAKSRASLLEELVQLQNRVQLLLSKIDQSHSELDASYSGDAWVSRSYRLIQSRLKDLEAALECNGWLLSGSCIPHPMRLEEMRLFPVEQSYTISPRAALWRNNLERGAGTALPAADLKDLFDIYFRHDLYGRFRHPDTIFLNRGISDPWFFTPPAGVSLSLDVANHQNWFGYSDPLGHIATREAVAALERHRRRQQEITSENIAVTQGATQSLSSVLGLLEKQGRKGKFLVPVPNYPPLVDQVEQRFKIERIALSNRYGWNFNAIQSKLSDPDALGIVLPVPHNPTTDGSVYKDLSKLAHLCSKTGRYLLIVENAFEDRVGGQINPISYPNTIIMASWSKTYGVAGLSLGHIIADRNFIDSFYRYASSAYGSPPSFLYLTATTLSNLELGRRLGAVNCLEPALAETLSSPVILFREFNHWCEAEALYTDFGDLILNLISDIRWYESLKCIQSDPIVPSVNRVLCTRLSGSSYRTFLSVLAAKNISILPVDCLAPPPDDRHDLRITVAVKPSELIQGLTATLEELDSLYAIETQNDWLHPDDKIWLEQIGLFNFDARLNFWGHVRRVQLRLKQIAQYAGLSIPVSVLRAAALHDLGKVWSLLDDKTADKEWRRLFGDFSVVSPIPLSQGDAAIGKYLLFASVELSMPPLPPEQISLLAALFDKASDGGTLSPWLNILDLADKTSDFRMMGSVSQEDLDHCLSLKSMQLKLRYPNACEAIENEFKHARNNLREIFASSM